MKSIHKTKTISAVDSGSYRYPTYAEIVQAHIDRTGTKPSFEERMRYLGVKIIMPETRLTEKKPIGIEFNQLKIELQKLKEKRLLKELNTQ